MLGFFKITGFTGATDSAGYRTMASAKSEMDDGIEANLYLPPYLRKAQCGIDAGSIVFAIVDDVSGVGAALAGEGSADFGYFVDADLTVKGDLAVKKGIVADDDVVAGTQFISLTSHWHGYIDSKGSGATPTPSKTQAPDTEAPA